MTSNLVISHNSEEFDYFEAITAYEDYEAGFRFNIDSLTIETKKLSKIILELESEFNELVKYDYSRNKNMIFIKYSNEKIKLFFQGNSTELLCSAIGKREKDIVKVWNMLLSNSICDNDVDIFAHSFVLDNHQLITSSKTIKPSELNYISKKYYPYIKTDVMFDQFFTGHENILLLVGEPGLGKSKLGALALKYAYENPDKLPYDKIEDNPDLDNQFISTVFVKSVDVLSSNAFWRNLDKNKIDFVIIDDLDFMLTKRDAEVQTQEDVSKNSFLNQFLSYTDGVEKNKTKFIITTNQSYSELDQAILRKGRLFDVLELRKLDKSEALDIWLENDFSEEEFNKTFSTHEILPAELGSEIINRKNIRINNSIENYLLEDGISKVQVASRKKKISL